MSGLGHEDSFPPPKPGVRYANRKRTLAGMSRDDEDAPIPAIHGPHQPDANLDDAGWPGVCHRCDPLMYVNISSFDFCHSAER